MKVQLYWFQIIMQVPNYEAEFQYKFQLMKVPNYYDLRVLRQPQQLIASRAGLVVVLLP